jgi:hypothetical protein
VVAREGLNSKMYPLMSLQVVVPVEALWTLVALERSVVGGRLLMLVIHEVRHGCSMSAVEARHHGGVTPNKRKLAIRVLDVREYGCLSRILQRWPLVILVG